MPVVELRRRPGGRHGRPARVDSGQCQDGGKGQRAVEGGFGKAGGKIKERIAEVVPRRDIGDVVGKVACYGRVLEGFAGAGW